MPLYRRRLPHLSEPGLPVFLTWRLHGSLPSHRRFPTASLTSGKAFATLDRLLDETRVGPFYLHQPEIADMVVDVLFHTAKVLQFCSMQAFVVMPNHVHLLATPNVPLSQLVKSLKGFTAKRANEMLGLIGEPFWQDESYDHLVRDSSSSEKIRRYIEQNPVRAGLAKAAEQYKWSSAGRLTGRSAADQEVRPTPIC
jgi:putative DNA methylase